MQRRLAVTTGISLALAFGIFFRLWDLNRAVVWGDEAMTLMWLSGHSFKEAYWAASDRILTLQELNKIEQRPRKATTMASVLTALEDCKLYRPMLYVTLFYWGKLFGYDIGRLRMCMAVIGLFAVGAAYWLGLELFRARCPALLVTAFFLVSPLAVHFSRELREASFVIFFTLLSSASFLFAYRSRQIRYWMLYSLITGCGFYASLSIGPIFMVHIAYAIVREKPWRGRLTRALCAALLASLLALLIASPTIFDYLFHYREAMKWLRWTQMPHMVWSFNDWITNFGLPFLFQSSYLFDPISLQIFSLCCLMFSATLFSALCVYRFNRQAFIYLGLICGLHFCLFLLPVAKILSVVPRYNLQFLIAQIFFVTFACWHYGRSATAWKRKTAYLAAGFLFVCCVSGSIYETYDQERSTFGPKQMALIRILGKDPSTLIVSTDAQRHNLICLRGLSHRYRLRKNRILWLSKPDNLNRLLPPGTVRFYLLNPPERLLACARDGLHYNSQRVNDWLVLMTKE
ncbi:MAG: glycosyltransferase family 39 protein [Candidatus Obscuribacterales bacterium]|nr:glycosyltransferase family 39 protein [Candidatus Obscuribacterales bacterium]